MSLARSACSHCALADHTGWTQRARQDRPARHEARSGRGTVSQACLPLSCLPGGPDPYVKVSVYYGRKRVAKKKTHVKKCTLSPVFNESFIYDIPADLLPDVTIEFLVIDFDRTTKNEVVGRLILGAHSVTASGAEHWREVCGSPRKPVVQWHSLTEY